MSYRGWNGKLRCEVPGCRFIIYMEGEPTEEGLDLLVTMAMDAHIRRNHPGVETTRITTMDVPGDISMVPENAFSAPDLGERTEPDKPKRLN